MIKLEKLQEPDVLRINSDRWTKELLASKDEDVKIKIKAKWNHRDIKTVLKKETHEKCAYCESKPLHVTFGDIEHICPKSRRFELAYKWDNLTLACEVCNGNKGSAEDLVDPYIDDLPSKFA